MAKKTKAQPRKMTPEQERRRQLLRHVGEIVFLKPKERGNDNSGWRQPLGEAIGVSRTSLYFCDTGARAGKPAPTPDWIDGKLLEFLRQHRKERAVKDAELAVVEREVVKYVHRRN